MVDTRIAVIERMEERMDEKNWNCEWRELSVWQRKLDVEKFKEMRNEKCGNQIVKFICWNVMHEARRVRPMNRQWLGRKGHQSLPCREKGTGQGAGLKKQEGDSANIWQRHNRCVYNSVTQPKVAGMDDTQQWLVVLDYVTALNHVRAALDSNESMGGLCATESINLAGLRPAWLASLIKGAIALSTVERGVREMSFVNVGPRGA